MSEEQGQSSAQDIETLNETLARLRAEAEQACNLELQAVLQKHGCELSPVITLGPSGVLSAQVRLSKKG